MRNSEKEFDHKAIYFAWDQKFLIAVRKVFTPQQLPPITQQTTPNNNGNLARSKGRNNPGKATRGGRIDQ
jgi:hypothetical protein